MRFPQPLVRGAVTRMLSGNHDVVGCANGDEALKTLENGETYDAVLCDLVMPVMGGPELYEALGEKMPTLRERMVFMTGGAFTDRAREFLVAGSRLAGFRRPIRTPGRRR